MAGFRIIGSGRYLPGEPYTNDMLSRVLDTSDEWIYKRTGIRHRHYCPEGQGPSDLAVPAARNAIEDAGIEPSSIDFILFNTMTPDYLLPGSGAEFAAKLGIPGVPALDMRQQCAAFVYSFQIASAMLTSGAAKRILIVGSEAHAGYMPWHEWDVLDGKTDKPQSQEDRERATRHRGFCIIFGDGAGALLLEATSEGDAGLLSAELHSDGSQIEQLRIPAGFKERPFINQKVVDEERMFLFMNGKEVFKHAISKVPQAVRAACKKASVSLDDIDWFVAYQANDRINIAIRERMKLAPAKVPSNIKNYGNTSGGTIPILMDEMRRDGRMKAGQLICVFALGAGMHWGAVIIRL